MYNVIPSKLVRRRFVIGLFGGVFVLQLCL